MTKMRLKSIADSRPKIGLQFPKIFDRLRSQIDLGLDQARRGELLDGEAVFDELERRDLSTGLVAMCTGGGMGTATIIERV